MAKITIEELYRGEKYDIMSAVTAKALFEKFEECMKEMHGVAERDAFSHGFRLGVQLMAESFLQPIAFED